MQMTSGRAALVRSTTARSFSIPLTETRREDRSGQRLAKTAAQAVSDRFHLRVERGKAPRDDPDVIEAFEQNVRISLMQKSQIRTLLQPATIFST